MKIELGKTKDGKLVYYYTKGEYVRVKLGTRGGCVDYRYKRIVTKKGKEKKGRLVLICIRKGEGKRGGKTKAVSIIRHLDEVKLNEIPKELRKFFYLAEKIREYIKKNPEVKKVPLKKLKREVEKEKGVKF